jgi:transposase
LPKFSDFNMPNKLRRNKRGGARFPPTDVSKPFRAPDSVKQVLARLTPTLTRVSDQRSRQNYWRQWLAEHLPPGLAPRLSGVVERAGTLVIFAESAAWSARLKYALQELEPAIRLSQPDIQQVSVRVMPKPAEPESGTKNPE